jgi:hypothetical protein
MPSAAVDYHECPTKVGTRHGIRRNKERSIGDGIGTISDIETDANQLEHELFLIMHVQRHLPQCQLFGVSGSLFHRRYSIEGTRASVWFFGGVLLYTGRAGAY